MRKGDSFSPDLQKRYEEATRRGDYARDPQKRAAAEELIRRGVIRRVNAPGSGLAPLGGLTGGVVPGASLSSLIPSATNAPAREQAARQTSRPAPAKPAPAKPKPATARPSAPAPSSGDTPGMREARRVLGPSATAQEIASARSLTPEQVRQRLGKPRTGAAGVGKVAQAPPKSLPRRAAEAVQNVTGIRSKQDVSNAVSDFALSSVAPVASLGARALGRPDLELEAIRMGQGGGAGAAGYSAGRNVAPSVGGLAGGSAAARLAGTLPIPNPLAKAAVVGGAGLLGAFGGGGLVAKGQQAAEDVILSPAARKLRDERAGKERKDFPIATLVGENLPSLLLGRPTLRMDRATNLQRAIGAGTGAASETFSQMQERKADPSQAIDPARIFLSALLGGGMEGDLTGAGRRVAGAATRATDAAVTLPMTARRLESGYDPAAFARVQAEDIRSGEQADGRMRAATAQEQEIIRLGQEAEVGFDAQAQPQAPAAPPAATTPPAAAVAPPATATAAPRPQTPAADLSAPFAMQEPPAAVPEVPDVPTVGTAEEVAARIEQKFGVDLAGRVYAVENREQAADALQKAFGYDEAYANAVATSYDAVMRGYARRNGVTTEEAYRTFLPAIVDGGEEFAQAIARTMGGGADADVSGTRGATLRMDDGRSIVVALASPDASSAIHEFGHIFRNMVEPQDVAVLDAWLNKKAGEAWTVADHEAFARSFERWTRTGDAPNPSLKAVFARFKEFLRGVYQSVRTASAGQSRASGGTLYAAPFNPEVVAMLKRYYDDVDAPAPGRAVVPEAGVPATVGAGRVSNTADGTTTGRDAGAAGAAGAATAGRAGDGGTADTGGLPGPGAADALAPVPAAVGEGGAAPSGPAPLPASPAGVAGGRPAQAQAQAQTPAAVAPDDFDSVASLEQQRATVNERIRAERARLREQGRSNSSALQDLQKRSKAIGMRLSAARKAEASASAATPPAAPRQPLPLDLDIATDPKVAAERILRNNGIEEPTPEVRALVDKAVDWGRKRIERGEAEWEQGYAIEGYDEGSGNLRLVSNKPDPQTGLFPVYDVNVKTGYSSDPDSADRLNKAGGLNEQLAAAGVAERVVSKHAHIARRLVERDYGYRPDAPEGILFQRDRRTKDTETFDLFGGAPDEQAAQRQRAEGGNARAAWRQRDLFTDMGMSEEAPRRGQQVRDSSALGGMFDETPAPAPAPKAEPVQDVLFQRDAEAFRDEQTRTPEFKRWFGDWQSDPANASKVVDADGKPLVVYHGTPGATFTTFREGGYFSPDPEQASVYTSTSASSINARPKKSDAPAVYPVYLNIKKPFDTRLPEVRRVFQRDFFMKWGNGTELSERGLPDWTDGEDIAEFITENNLDYDGIVLDEGSLPREDGDPVWRGVSYRPMRPEQIKSATGNSGAFDPQNPDILFQRDAQDADPNDPARSTADNRRTVPEPAPPLVNPPAGGADDDDPFAATPDATPRLGRNAPIPGVRSPAQQRALVRENAQRAAQQTPEQQARAAESFARAQEAAATGQRTGRVNLEPRQEPLPGKAKTPLLQKAARAPAAVKAVVASGDLGLVGRQGLMLAVRSPKNAAEAALYLARALAPDFMGGAKAVEGLYERIESDRLFKESQQAGLFLHGVASRKAKLAGADEAAQMGAREESFASPLVERIPGLRQVERGNTAFLDALRYAAFRDMAAQVEKGAKDVPGFDREAEMATLARFVNYASGRGDLGKLSDATQNFLNGALFSPRWVASRFQVFADPRLYASKTPAARKAIVRANLQYAGTVLTALTLLKASGAAEVETDPDSPKFGQVTLAGRSYDISGGVQNNLRMVLRVAKAVGAGESERVGEILMQWIRNKESPVAGFISDQFFPNLAPDRFSDDTAKKLANPFSRRKVTKEERLQLLGRRIVRLVSPILVGDVRDTLKAQAEGKETPAQSAAAAPAVFLGFGGRRYDENKPPAKKKSGGGGDPGHAGRDPAGVKAMLRDLTSGTKVDLK